MWPPAHREQKEVREAGATELRLLRGDGSEDRVVVHWAELRRIRKYTVNFNPASKNNSASPVAQQAPTTRTDLNSASRALQRSKPLVSLVSAGPRLGGTSASA
jgi:hypothetical protein